MLRVASSLCAAGTDSRPRDQRHYAAAASTLCTRNASNCCYFRRAQCADAAFQSPPFAISSCSAVIYGCSTVMYGYNTAIYSSNANVHWGGCRHRLPVLTLCDRAGSSLHCEIKCKNTQSQYNLYQERFVVVLDCVNVLLLYLIAWHTIPYISTGHRLLLLLVKIWP